MQFLPSQSFEVLHPSTVGAAPRAAKALAGSIGFDPDACEEIALAAAELATNAIKHAGGGRLVLTPLADGERAGLQIEAQDAGPGIDDVEQALADRFSTAGTHGTGLGAVNRLMDELDMTSHRGQGTCIVCRKWVRQPAATVRPCPLAFGVATRPRRPGEENGDAYVVKQWGESALVGIIDGLGHGQFARRAAQAARQYVEGHFDRPLDQVFRGTGRACSATRGVVMALARFDWGLGRLALASVGNIEIRVFPHPEPFRFFIRRGVLGLNAPNAVVSEHDWPLDHVLVLHSDGLRTHWGRSEFSELVDLPAPALAQCLLSSLATEEDDATVLVVRSATP